MQMPIIGILAKLNVVPMPMHIKLNVVPMFMLPIIDLRGLGFIAVLRITLMPGSFYM